MHNWDTAVVAVAGNNIAANAETLDHTSIYPNRMISDNQQFYFLKSNNFNIETRTHGVGKKLHALTHSTTHMILLSMAKYLKTLLLVSDIKGYSREHYVWNKICDMVENNVGKNDFAKIKALFGSIKLQNELQEDIVANQTKEYNAKHYDLKSYEVE